MKKRSSTAGAERKPTKARKFNHWATEGLLELLPTKARKCNHWATGGLLEFLGSKFNGTDMHIKFSFY